MWWFACTAKPIDLGSASAPPDPSLPTKSPEWRAGAPLPGPRQECGVVALDGQIVVIGGYDDGPSIVDTVEAYDPVGDAWSKWPSLPAPLHHPNVAVLEGQVHVAGGLGNGFLEQSVHWVYDEDTSTWVDAPALPADRAVGAAGVAVVGGKLHLIGGLHQLETVAWHTVYDPETAEWELLPDAPSARDHHAVAAIDGVVIVTAGRAGGLSSFVSGTDRWDGVNWTVGAPIPTARGGVMAAASPDGRLHVLGGEGHDLDPAGVFAEHEAYDPASDSWEVLAPLSEPRHGTGAAFADETLWVPGGADEEAFAAVATNTGWNAER